MNLVYNILKFDKAFALQITHQSPKCREYLGMLGGTYHAINGWAITSVNIPEVATSRHTIYLRGDNTSRDLRVDRTYNLPSNWERDMLINSISLALNEFIGRMDTLEIISGFVVPAYQGIDTAVPETSKTSGPNTIEGKPVISA
jgi:hypothetical protein